jgi:hypothetical protein
MFTKLGDALITTDRVLALRPRVSDGACGIVVTFENG